MTPAYANVFMGMLEETMLARANIKPKYYKRFINDIFMVIKCTDNELIERMNKQNPSIQFTHEHNTQEITFLDVTVYKKKDKFQVKTYIKPTAVHQKYFIPPTRSHKMSGTGGGHQISESQHR